MYQIGLFATGRGEGSRGLLKAMGDAIQHRELNVRISFVFCNREKGEFGPTDTFLDMVEGYDLPLVTYSYRKFRAELGDDPEWRIKYDREVMERLQKFKPDLCVLAGYLLIVGPEMCERYKMVNLHPAPPGGPIGMWQEVIWQYIEKRATLGGNTMFYVTSDLDRGPTVTYCTFPLHSPDFDPLWDAIGDRNVADLKAKEGEELPLFMLIRENGVIRERPLVVETVKAFAEGRVSVTDRSIVDASGSRIGSGIDLTSHIEAKISGRRTHF